MMKQLQKELAKLLPDEKKLYADVIAFECDRAFLYHPIEDIIRTTEIRSDLWELFKQTTAGKEFIPILEAERARQALGQAFVVYRPPGLEKWSNVEYSTKREAETAFARLAIPGEICIILPVLRQPK